MKKAVMPRSIGAVILLVCALSACSSNTNQNSESAQTGSPATTNAYSTLTFRTSAPSGYHPIAAAQIPRDRYYDGWAAIVEHGDGVAAAYGIKDGNPVLVLTQKGKAQSHAWDCQQTAWGGPGSSLVCDKIPNALLGK